MPKRNTESAEQAKKLSHRTTGAADTAALHIAEMKRAMEAIKASSSDISKIIGAIGSSSFVDTACFFPPAGCAC